MAKERSVKIDFVAIPSNDPKEITLKVSIDGIDVDAGCGMDNVQDVSFVVSLREYQRWLRGFAPTSKELREAYKSLCSRDEGQDISADRRREIDQKAMELFPG